MLNLTPAQTKVIADIGLSLIFQSVGNNGAIVAYSGKTDYYINVDGVGVIEDYNHSIGGYDYFSLDWEPLNDDTARDLINSMS